MIYNPFDWYWLADDGRLFYSGSGGKLTTETDPDFVARKTQWEGPDPSSPWWVVYSAWPKDSAGAQTNAALQAVVEPYGITVAVDLTAYAATARYTKEIAGITVGGIKVATDDRSKLLISGTRDAAADDPTFTTPFVGTDGSIVVLNAQQIIGLANAVMLHVRGCFATYAQVTQDITAGKVKTPSDVDAAFAAMTV